MNLIDVTVIGSHSPEGENAFNKNLAEARARALDSLVREIAPTINPEVSISHPAAGYTGDYRRLRSAKLQVVYRKIVAVCEKMLPDTAGRQEKVVPKEPCDSVAAETQFVDTVSTIAPFSGVIAYPRNSYPVSSQSRPLKERDRQSLADRLFVSTNMLYDIALTPNIGAGISVSDRVTLLADWMYARWSNHDRRRYWRIYGGDVEVRYRIGSHRKGSPLGGHYVGVYGSMACYDFQAGRSHTGALSDTYNYAAGISYTYSLPVSVHFNIDFSLGIGYLWGKYKTHTPIDDCDVWLSTHKLEWLGPTRAGVSLVWLLGKRVKNDRKGGLR